MVWVTAQPNASPPGNGPFKMHVSPSNSAGPLATALANIYSPPNSANPLTIELGRYTPAPWGTAREGHTKAWRGRSWMPMRTRCHDPAVARSLAQCWGKSKAPLLQHCVVFASNSLLAPSCYPEGCAAPGKVQCQCNAGGPLSKLERTPPP